LDERGAVSPVMPSQAVVAMIALALRLLMMARQLLRHRIS
jgi:hypothetical protein